MSNPAVPIPATGTHLVVAGDTLGAIAQKRGVTLKDLLRWNAISNPDLIQAGDTINLADSRGRHDLRRGQGRHRLGDR